MGQWNSFRVVVLLYPSFDTVSSPSMGVSLRTEEWWRKVNEASNFVVTQQCFFSKKPWFYDKKLRCKQKWWWPIPFTTCTCRLWKLNIILISRKKLILFLFDKECFLGDIREILFVSTGLLINFQVGNYYY